MNAETTEVTTPTTGFTLLPPTNGQPTSAIPIAWCVSEEIQHFLAQRGVDDAFVLVVVTHVNREVSRYVFPSSTSKALCTSAVQASTRSTPLSCGAGPAARPTGSYWTCVAAGVRTPTT
jgi:hypothetical protein